METASQNAAAIPVAKGLAIGHEPIGAIEKLGSTVEGFQKGQRVIVGAITSSGYSNACLCGCGSQDGRHSGHGCQGMGGWRFGNGILKVAIRAGENIGGA